MIDAIPIAQKMSKFHIFGAQIAGFGIVGQKRFNKLYNFIHLKTTVWLNIK